MMVVVILRADGGSKGRGGGGKGMLVARGIGPSWGEGPLEAFELFDGSADSRARHGRYWISHGIGTRLGRPDQLGVDGDLDGHGKGGD